jgi:hypothetical protein
MAENLAEVQLKLVRAEKHLHEALGLISKFAEGECTIALEADDDRKMYVQRVRLSPSASPEISAVAGDFFGNVRTALDYIVTQLVLANGHVPTKANAFLIADDPGSFKEYSSRRLKGIAPKAAALIESLQPYKRRDNPLGILNRLVNIDKHHSLNVVTVVADNTDLVAMSGNFSMFLGNEELRDGTIFGGIGLPFHMARHFPTFNERLPTMKMHGKCSLFVAFDDPSAEELENFRVDRTLEGILEFMRNVIVPAFEPFFD